MRKTTRFLAMATFIALAVTAFGCGSGGGNEKTPPPTEPSGVRAAPGNGQVTVTWNASPGATSYNVSYDFTSTVTPAPKTVGATASPAVIGGLTNGTSYWFAVSAVGPGGESGQTPGGCAVPTAASQAGVTLRDPLCGGSLSGATWWPNGAAAALVSGGEALLSASMAQMEPYAAHGSQYTAFANVAAAGSRVTTLRAKIRVPAATAARSTATDARVRAGIRLLYSPPARRLNFPAANQDLVNFEVGLIDMGPSLQAVRQVTHCDDPSCGTFNPGGVTFTDPPGFTALSGGELAGVTAYYDQTYIFEVQLAEGEGTVGVFHWSMTGTFGAVPGIRTLTGSADPAAYLAGAAGWTGVALSGSGFANAQLSARVLDRSATGAGTAKLTAYFDDVQVGLNNGAATAWDDFSGTAGNSGPVELSPAKWTPPGANTIGAAGGGVSLHSQATSAGGSVSYGQGLVLADPASVNTLQADLRVVASSTSGGATPNAHVQGRFYNDGTTGAEPGSALGDVLAGLFLHPDTNSVGYMVARCLNPTCSGGVGPVESGPITGATVGTGVHTARVTWDPGAQRFRFAYDGYTATVDPTAAAPVAGTANAPYRRIFSVVGTPASAGAAGMVEVRVNNVFTAP